MLAIGNDELGEIVEEGDLIANKCGKGELHYGTDSNGDKSSMLGFISIGSSCYLVAIKNQLISGCTKVLEVE